MFRLPTIAAFGAMALAAWATLADRTDTAIALCALSVAMSAFDLAERAYDRTKEH